MLTDVLTKSKHRYKDSDYSATYVQNKNNNLICQIALKGKMFRRWKTFESGPLKKKNYYQFQLCFVNFSTIQKIVWKTNQKF